MNAPMNALSNPSPSGAVFRARDLASAMEAALDSLGPDAVILSVTNRDGQVELIASVGFAPVATPSSEPEVAAAVTPAPRSPDQVTLPDLTGPGRIVVAGMAGSGRSTIALQIAGMARVAGRAVDLVVPRLPGRAARPDLVQRSAGLLGLSVQRPVLPGLMRTPAPRGVVQVVDLSDIGPLSPADAAALGGVLLLALPTGLKPAMIEQLCAPWRDTGALVVLTRSDLWQAEQDELDAIAAAGLRLGWIGPGATLAADLIAAAPPECQKEGQDC